MSKQSKLSMLLVAFAMIVMTLSQLACGSCSGDSCVPGNSGGADWTPKGGGDVDAAIEKAKQDAAAAIEQAKKDAAAAVEQAKKDTVKTIGKAAGKEVSEYCKTHVSDVQCP